MGIMAYSLLGVMQDVYHQPYVASASVSSVLPKPPGSLKKGPCVSNKNKSNTVYN